LAVVATSRVRLGTGIRPVVERDPIRTVKRVACLDHLSIGRFDFGIGGGWIPSLGGTDGTARIRFDRFAGEMRARV
jgi:alkanesulfonate monooxygenase SsuD/methylene tetrahydromethanopterin reductase-like flavin-dependent oxidoreductase (luciferase family)